MRLQENYLDCDEPVDTLIAGYQWRSNAAESEASQRVGYMSVYITLSFEDANGDRGDFQLEDMAHDESLLSIVDPRLSFRINGTTDVLLVKRRAKNPVITLAGNSMVTELKKQVEFCHLRQALGQLVSCSLKVPLHYYSVSLMTYPNHCWHFSWFNKQSVVTQLKLMYSKNAIDFIVAAVAEREGLIPFRVPFIEMPLKKLSR